MVDQALLVEKTGLLAEYITDLDDPEILVGILRKNLDDIRLFCPHGQ